MVWLGRHGARTIGTDARFEGLCPCRPCAGVVPVLMSSRPAALACPPLADHCIWSSNAKLMRLARSLRPSPWRRALRNGAVAGGRACPGTRDTPPGDTHPATPATVLLP